MSGENCLSGLKILDLTQFEAVSSCTEALAWLGADVVKIENPGSGDPGRSIGRISPDADALYFLQYNSNKRSAAINLKDPRGLELVKRLIKCADVMIENFAPGAIERLGLGYEAIKAVNPAIIYCQVKGFGTGSPFEKNLAFDMIAQASGGLMSITGEEDGKPCKAGATVGDTGTGMVMAISILAAYVRCLRTGQGEHLVVGMQDLVIHYIRNAFAYMDRSDGKAAPRIGSRTVGGGQPPIGVYPCKGGGPNDYVYIYAGAASPEHWNRLLKAMGREDLIGDTRYSTAAARLKRRAEVDEIVANWTCQFDKHTGDAPRRRNRPGRSGARYTRDRRRSDLRAAQNPADHGAPGDRQLHDERLAGPLRRRAAGRRSGAAIGTARRRCARRLAQDGRCSDRHIARGQGDSR